MIRIYTMWFRIWNTPDFGSGIQQKQKRSRKKSHARWGETTIVEKDGSVERAHLREDGGRQIHGEACPTSCAATGPNTARAYLRQDGRRRIIGEVLWGEREWGLVLRWERNSGQGERNQIKRRYSIFAAGKKLWKREKEAWKKNTRVGTTTTCYNILYRLPLVPFAPKRCYTRVEVTKDG